MSSYDSRCVLSLGFQMALLYPVATTKGIRFSEGSWGRAPVVPEAGLIPC